MRFCISVAPILLASTLWPSYASAQWSTLATNVRGVPSCIYYEPTADQREFFCGYVLASPQYEQPTPGAYQFRGVRVTRTGTVTVLPGGVPTLPSWPRYESPACVHVGGVAVDSLALSSILNTPGTLTTLHRFHWNGTAWETATTIDQHQSSIEGLTCVTFSPIESRCLALSYSSGMANTLDLLEWVWNGVTWSSGQLVGGRISVAKEPRLSCVPRSGNQIDCFVRASIRGNRFALRTITFRNGSWSGRWREVGQNYLTTDPSCVTTSAQGVNCFFGTGTDLVHIYFRGGVWRTEVPFQRKDGLGLDYRRPSCVAWSGAPQADLVRCAVLDTIAPPGRRPQPQPNAMSDLVTQVDWSRRGGWRMTDSDRPRPPLFGNGPLFLYAIECIAGAPEQMLCVVAGEDQSPPPSTNPLDSAYWVNKYRGFFALLEE
jgi:hypothetical protein